MKKILLISVGVIGLGLTLIPSILVFAGSISLQTHRNLMFIGTVLWMLTAPLWLGRDAEEQA